MRKEQMLWSKNDNDKCNKMIARSIDWRTSLSSVFGEEILPPNSRKGNIIMYACYYDVFTSTCNFQEQAASRSTTSPKKTWRALSWWLCAFQKQTPSSNYLKATDFVYPITVSWLRSGSLESSLSLFSWLRITTFALVFRVHALRWKRTRNKWSIR